MSDKVNIQNEIQKIHSKYGITEKANYEIQKFCESYADQELKNVLEDIREEMCGVSQEYHKELLEDALTRLKKTKG